MRVETFERSEPIERVSRLELAPIFMTSGVARSKEICARAENPGKGRSDTVWDIRRDDTVLGNICTSKHCA